MISTTHFHLGLFLLLLGSQLSGTSQIQKIFPHIYIIINPYYWLDVLIFVVSPRIIWYHIVHHQPDVTINRNVQISTSTCYTDVASSASAYAYSTYYALPFITTRPLSASEFRVKSLAKILIVKREAMNHVQKNDTATEYCFSLIIVALFSTNVCT